MLFKLFKLNSVKFSAIDPLGDGLREEIASEQNEPEAMTLQEGPDGDSLSQFWEGVQSDIEQDPTWFKFSEEE